MSEYESQNKPIAEILAQELSEYGYDKKNRISRSELLLFLDRKSPDGKFDPALTEKLFQTLNLSNTSTISIEKFINGFSEFEDEIKKSAVSFNTKYSKEKELYDQVVEQLRKYQSEKSKEEDTSENAVLSGEIIDIDLKTKIEGIKEIIIKVILGEQEQEITQNINGEEESEKENKFFEFKTSSKQDNLEFILQAKNDSGDITNIGSKAYSLEGINTQDEFLVAIGIPENANVEDESNEVEENLAAEIKAKISMLSSNLKYYNFQKRKEENKLRKLTTEVEQAEDYVKKVQDIYGGDSRNSVQTSKKEKCENEEKSRSTNQKLAEKNNQDDNFNNRKIFEFSISKYIVEFNSERYDEIISKGVEVDFNNTIKVASPIKLSQVDEEQNEKDKESENKEQNEENENEQVEQENENEQVEQENEQVEQNEQEEQEQIEQNENQNELVEQNMNELVAQNGNIEENQNDQRFEDLLYSNKTSLNFDENQITNENENEYVDQNNINLGEYNQGENINSELLQGYGDIIHNEQNYSFVNKAVVNESTNKVLVQESTLPLKYLPEKVNKVIVDSNVGTLPLIIGRKSVTYSTGYDNMNNLMGMSQPSQYDPTSFSYQIPNNTNFQYSM
jgi:poly(rC)-binding protein 2/3/4